MIRKISGKTYVWEKPGFGGDFTITLKEDGTFTFYEGMLSSFFGAGNWSVEDGILTLVNDESLGMSFRFDIQDDVLIFRAADSSEFIYAKVEDGDRFVLQENIVIESKPILIIEVNKQFFYAEFEDNSSANALIEKLEEGPLTLDMHDYGSFEKVAELPWQLPTNDERITTRPGDIILYQGNQLTVYYAENTWVFTRVAHIEGAEKQMLAEQLGTGDVTVTFWLEWSE
ncbi:MAG: hypothetical protein K6A14_08215 [Erysipelotrichaceae bacterium]|nr:hypothetical protein [Erysipelotrichaceae bacterium]